MLTAWCELRRDFRNFRLDRMEALKDTGEQFDDEAGKTWEDFMRLIDADTRPREGRE